MIQYRCPSCGSEFLAGKMSETRTCPYCGNALKDAGKGTPPRAKMIPFSISKEQAVEAFQKRNFEAKCPDEDALMKALHKVYIPYMVYNGKANGTVQFEYRRRKQIVLKKKWGEVPISNALMCESTGADLSRIDFAEGYRLKYAKQKVQEDALIEVPLKDKKDRYWNRLQENTEQILKPLFLWYGEKKADEKADNPSTSFIFWKDSEREIFLPVWYAKVKNEAFTVNGQTGDLLPYYGVSIDKRFYRDDLVPGTQYYKPNLKPYLKRFAIASIVGFLIGGVIGLLLHTDEPGFLFFSCGIISWLAFLMAWGTLRRHIMFKGRNLQTKRFFLPVKSKTKAVIRENLSRTNQIQIDYYQRVDLACELHIETRKL